MPGPASAARDAAAEPRDHVPRLVRTELAARAMGGRLGIHVATTPGNAAAAARDARSVAGRVQAWSRLITRHDPGSPLMRLNADPRPSVPVSPTLGAALAWAADAGRLTEGLVDATRLDERLAAEHGGALGVAGGPAGLAPRAWSLDLASPRRAAVTRVPGTRFDLDGVGKGWLADRALQLLDHHPGAIVDADGDIAVRIAPGDRWEIGVADPRTGDDLLAVIVLADEPGAPARGRRTWGVATSGTTIHRFGATAHHLIDPRSGLPAATDVVQATVLASRAAAAEAFAKSAVILGSAAGLDFLDRSGVAGAVLLLEDGRVLAIPRTSAFLA
jgi:FAD:protein FMN transferase